MPVLLQVCIVIVTVGLLVSLLLVVRMISRFFARTVEDLARLSGTVRDSVVQIELATSEARSVVAAVRDCVPPIRRVVDRFEAVGQRTADLSAVVLEELELPVYTVAAATRGVSFGASHLLKRLVYRFTHRHSQNSGGHDHE